MTRPFQVRRRGDHVRQPQHGSERSPVQEPPRRSLRWRPTRLVHVRVSNMRLSAVVSRHRCPCRRQSFYWPRLILLTRPPRLSFPHHVPTTSDAGELWLSRSTLLAEDVHHAGVRLSRSKPRNAAPAGPRAHRRVRYLTALQEGSFPTDLESGRRMALSPGASTWHAFDCLDVMRAGESLRRSGVHGDVVPRAL
jgi:hypothetical protein